MLIVNYFPNFVLKNKKRDRVIEDVKWSWACRILVDNDYYLIDDFSLKPDAGDLVLVKIEKISQHNSIIVYNNKKLRLYPGDLIVGILGNRYATDVFEGKVDGLNNLCLMTNGGLVSTLKSKNSSAKKPTTVSFLGYISNKDGAKINLKHNFLNLKQKFSNRLHSGFPKNVVLVVGTGMNSGKTTIVRMLIRSLRDKNVNVCACKLTGSISNRDKTEMESSLANRVLDFSDYGFPSTYMCAKNELITLFYTMLNDLNKSNPDVIVMEIADGILQRETEFLLNEQGVKEHVCGVALAADNSPSALFSLSYLRNLNFSIFFLSGTITSSPLYIQEFQKNTNYLIPVISSASDEELKPISNSIIKFLSIKENLIK